MKTLVTTLSLVLLCNITSAQKMIEGDQLLTLVGKNVSAPLFQQLKQQETFYTDAWDQNFTIYINRDNSGNIIEVEVQNGKKRYGSTDRYGHYKRTIPMQLTWSMGPSDFAAKLGSPVLVSTAMNFSDYRKDDWKVRVFFEENRPVSISFTKAVQTNTPSAPVSQPVAVKPPQAGDIKPGWLIRIENGKAQFNWETFSNVINNFYSLNKYAGNDSTDYIGQVYYTSKIQMQGFERVSVKRVKSDGKWYLEGFFKIEADSNKAREASGSDMHGLQYRTTQNVGESGRRECQRVGRSQSVRWARGRLASQPRSRRHAPVRRPPAFHPRR